MVVALQRKAQDTEYTRGCAHISLVYMIESSFSEDISVLPPMNRGTRFTCHGVEKFHVSCCTPGDYCVLTSVVSVTFLFLAQSTQNHGMTVSDRRRKKPTRRRTCELQDGRQRRGREPLKRRQEEDLRAPGRQHHRRQDRCTDLVSKATRRRPTRSRKAEHHHRRHNKRLDAREEATEEKKTCQLQDGNIAEVSVVSLKG